MLHEYVSGEPFVLENGAILPGIVVAYHTYGTLNAAADNVVWVCHALTASADAAGWWPGVVGPGCMLDTNRYFIVCANILGSCYGTTGPLSINPDSGFPYYDSFPQFTIRDMVRAHTLLRRSLGIGHIHILAGGSMGGFQALEWAVTEPEVIGSLLLLATSAAETAWGMAIHAAQRLAIEADATWSTHTPDAGRKGLIAARAIGMLTYRNQDLFVAQQTDTDIEKTDDFRASSYINYQGRKLAGRFSSYSYWYLTKAMDTHNIARGRAGNPDAILAELRMPVLLIAISNDLLCPPSWQRRMAAHIPDCSFCEIGSAYGHDGFIIEHEKITAHFHAWRQQKDIY